MMHVEATQADALTAFFTPERVAGLKADPGKTLEHLHRIGARRIGLDVLFIDTLYLARFPLANH